jgi:Lhr-like helicase
LQVQRAVTKRILQVITRGQRIGRSEAGGSKTSVVVRVPVDRDHRFQGIVITNSRAS